MGVFSVFLLQKKVNVGLEPNLVGWRVGLEVERREKERGEAAGLGWAGLRKNEQKTKAAGPVEEFHMPD